MLNKVVLMGRLTKDPELKHTKTNNVPVVGFSLAVDRRIAKDKPKETDFFNVIAWQSTAEFVTKHFIQGQQICVEGRLQLRKWTDKATDAIRYATEVVAESVHFAGFKRDDVQNSGVNNESRDDFDPCAELDVAA